MHRAATPARSSRSPIPSDTASTSATILSEHPIAARWRSLREEAGRGKPRAALIPYLTAGYPTPELSREALQLVAAAGADFVEVGVPFSDPLADGHGGAPPARRAQRDRLSLPDLAARRHRHARRGAAGPPQPRGARPGRVRPAARRGVWDQHAHSGTGCGPAGGRRRGGERAGRDAPLGRPRGGGAAGARPRGGRPGRAGARRMTAGRLVRLYSQALPGGGPLLLLAVLIADPRW